MVCRVLFAWGIFEGILILFYCNKIYVRRDFMWELAHVVVEAEKSYNLASTCWRIRKPSSIISPSWKAFQPGAQDVWTCELKCRFPSSSETVSSPLPFCSSWALTGGGRSVHSVTESNANLSRKHSQTHPEIMFQHFSRHPLAESSGHTRLAITMTLIL